MMDPAFLAFSDALAEMLDFRGEIVDEEAGVRSHITQCTIELPIELDVSRDDSGALVLGSAPPLYYVDTSYRPSYHRIRVTATPSDAPTTHHEGPDGR
jgi:hypothetical protein